MISNNARTIEIERLINEFREKFQAGTIDSENFMTIHEIERMWGELLGNTQNIYLDMVSELISNVNESELIRKKKENIHKKG
jgi:hypothetical protein